MSVAAMEKSFTHEPVLLKETLAAWAPRADGFYLDATLGLGGHAEALLESRPEARLLGLDLDAEALDIARRRLEAFPGRVTLRRGNFRRLAPALAGLPPLSGALFDLGVSSLQLDKASRGFAFREEGPLDMRLDAESPLSAARIVNEWPLEQLEMILREYGEEPKAGRIARWIVSARSEKPIESTRELAGLLEAHLPRTGKTHPATRTFMALRIAVNQELENLTGGLECVLPFLEPGGRLAVITFHSLEDRIVKNVFKSFVAHGLCRLLTPSPLRPEPTEVEKNPRSRSAKLRVAEKRP